MSAAFRSISDRDVRRVPGVEAADRFRPSAYPTLVLGHGRRSVARGNDVGDIWVMDVLADGAE
jgi:hypothetical protein